MKLYTQRLLFLSLMFLSISNCLFSQLPPDFIDETLNSSLAKPVGITFDESGKAYIWEQSGLVHIMDTTGNISDTPLIDIREEVSEFVDHGLLGFTLDPQFLDNGYLYLLYVVDPHHLYKYGTPGYDPNATIINEATIGRITRYTANRSDNYESILENSRKVLLGANPSTGFPVVASSHGVGTLTFGTDGTLIASCGETGSFFSADAGSHEESFYEQALQKNIIRPAENVGAYRAQMLHSLGGKIIRIDPETGLGLPTNPFYELGDPASVRSKIWARGLRNPFRIYLDPSTGSHNPEDGQPGTLFIGDVGAAMWEELNIATQGGLNFGWPIYEGMEHHYSFYMKMRDNLDAANPYFDPNNCSHEYYTFHDLLDAPNALITPIFTDTCSPQNQIPESLYPSIHSRPTIAWRNQNIMTDSVAVVPAFNQEGEAITYELENPESGVTGTHFNGSSSLAGFHYTGDNFPEEYQGRYFHGDFDGWISIFDFDEEYQLIKVDTFATAVTGMVDLKVSPYDGCLYYVKALEGPSVHRICYGGDPPPVAIAKSDVAYGPSPLTVQLDASESYHPKNYPFTIQWLLPDGSSSDAPTLDYVFEANSSAPAASTVQLIVTDSLGNMDTDELMIGLNNTPPSVDITSIQWGDQYPLSGFTYLPLQAEVSDAEHTDEELTYEWQTFLYHNTHNHAGPIDHEKTTFTLLEPIGCGDEAYWYRVELTVSDPVGLSSKKIVEVYPYCGAPFGEDVNLSGEAKTDKNILSWSNVDEQHLAAYEIQRSKNATDFITIGTINKWGGHIFEDTAPFWGTNRYRIKVIQTNGSYDYSNAITLNFPANRSVSVFPNPTDGILNLMVKESTGNIDFELLDITGRIWISRSWLDDLKNGIDVSFSIEDLANGVYYYRVKNGLDTYQGSILKVQ